MIPYHINNLQNIDGMLAAAIAGIPEDVTHLDLSWNSLHEKTGTQLATAFAGIPESVTHLDLSVNHLHEKTGAELATAFAGIPASVTHLDLAGNYLHEKTGAELATAFAGIPRSVTHLDLAGNYLGEKTGAELAIAFAGIPASVTHLDFGGNDFDTKTSAELAIAFAGIPRSVTHLNLGGNSLGGKTGAELATAFAGIRPGVTISFKNDGLFVNKTHAQRDELLIRLRQAAPHLNLDLSNNGESDIQRALAPMACLMKKTVGSSGSVCQELMVYILSFLAPEKMPSSTLDLMLSRTFNMICNKASQNEVTKIGVGLFKSSTSAIVSGEIIESGGEAPLLTHTTRI